MSGSNPDSVRVPKGGGPEPSKKRGDEVWGPQLRGGRLGTQNFALFSSASKLHSFGTFRRIVAPTSHGRLFFLLLLFLFLLLLLLLLLPLRLPFLLFVFLSSSSFSHSSSNSILPPLVLSPLLLSSSFLPFFFPFLFLLFFPPSLLLLLSVGSMSSNWPVIATTNVLFQILPRVKCTIEECIWQDVCSEMMQSRSVKQHWKVTRGKSVFYRTRSECGTSKRERKSVFPRYRFEGPDVSNNTKIPRNVHQERKKE